VERIFSVDITIKFDGTDEEFKRT